ncbi:MAG: hypothetical protein JWO38_6114 [Gemmataceae bacterium]|nr:hypothetical protein [Gemmataceae bacterium]
MIADGLPGGDELAALDGLRCAWERQDWPGVRAHLEVLLAALGRRGAMLIVRSWPDREYPGRQEPGPS